MTARLVLVAALAAGCGHPAAHATPRDASAVAHDHVIDADWGAVKPPPAAPTGALRGSFVAVSRDGALVASVEGFQVVRIRDTATWKVRTTVPLCLAGAATARAFSACLPSRLPSVDGLAFSPDGASLAIACDGCAPGPSLHVIDVASGALRFARGLSSTPRLLAWGDAIAVALDPALVFVDPASGAERSAVTASVRGLAPDGSSYLTGSTIVSLPDGTARDTRESLQDAIVLLPAHAGYVVTDSYSAKRFGPNGEAHGDLFDHAGSDQVAATADGRYVAAIDSSSSGTVLNLIELEPRQLVLQEPLDRDAPTYAGSVAIGPGGAVYVPTPTDGVHRIVRKPVAKLLAVSRDGAHLLAVEEEAAGGYVAQVRDTSAAMAAVGTPVASTAPSAAAFSPDGRQVAVGDGASLVIVTVDGSRAAQTIALPFAASAIAWGTDRLIALGAGQLVAVDWHAGKITSLATGTIEGIAPDASSYCLRAQEPAYEKPNAGGGHAWVQPPAQIGCVAIASGKRHEVGQGIQGSVIALDGGAALVVAGSLLELHDATGAATAHIAHEFMDDVAIATSPDGRWVAQVDGNYNVVLFDLRAQKQVSQQSPPTKPTAIAVAPDGTVFVGQEGGATLRFGPP